MKLLSVVAMMTVALVVLTAPWDAAAEQQTPAASQTPAPAAPVSAQAPVRPPFPPDAKYAYLDLQRVASESNDGRAANERVEALSDVKIAEIEALNLDLQASQQRLQQNANVMSGDAQLQLQREIERLSRDVERMSQDAESEVQELQQTLQLEFQQKLVPAIDRIAIDKGLDFIFSAGDGGLLWANPALDITADVILEVNASVQ